MGMVLGQLLFKLSSQQLPGGTLAAKLVSLFLNPAFMLAMILYFGLSLGWVWILSFTPLSRAYPFLSIASVVTPLVGALLFHEPLSAGFLMGVTLVGVGLYLIASPG
jgi:drug/metabolite transporter (DMT)-like permease